jgi:hypothetical protein
MTLRLSGATPTSVFSLLGTDENSATFAMGWALDQCPTFMDLFLRDVIGLSSPVDEVIVDLQRHHSSGGFTDIEIIGKNFCHLIVEAKSGWAIPGTEQLATYARRLTRHDRAERRILSISAASLSYAAGRLVERIDDVPVSHRSWSDIQQLAEAARQNASGHEEKLWLRHLYRHLEGYVSMQNPRDNLVYVVSLSDDPIKDGNPYTWIDVVEKDHRYFHPVGNRWPLLPPNYIAFRYYGELQSVHHIDGYAVVTNLSDQNAQWPWTDSDHFVYSLGPPMRPARQMRTGNIYRNHRVRCAIDTLLSGAYMSISAARDETSRRLARTEADIPE